MPNPASSLIALLAAAPLLAVTPAFGQDQPVLLDDITLSANRTPTEAARSGVSVTVVTAEELRKAGDRQLSSYLARLPGVSVTQNGPMGTTTNLRIRGADSRHIAVYIDGIRVDDPTGTGTAFDFGTLMSADVGRVEILRGSQSALWGSNAMGGVINIASLQGMEEGLHQSVALEAGSQGTASARYSFGQRTARSETSFNLTHARTDGFSAKDTLPRTPGAEKDGFEATRLSFSTRYQATENLSVGAAGFAQRSTYDYDYGGPNSAGDYFRRTENGLRLFADWETGNTTHSFNATSYRVTRKDHVTGVQSGLFKGGREGFSYQGTTTISQALSFVYGADTNRERGNFELIPGTVSTRVSGVFGQALWRPTDAFDLSLSLRRDDHSDFGGHSTGRLALAWQAAPGLTLRAAAATGYLAPSLYQRFGDPRWTIIANPALEPEKSKSIEVGLDYRMAGGASFGLTLFHIDTDNAIGYVPCPSGPPTWSCAPGTANFYANESGTTRRKGVELSAHVPVGARLGLGLAYTYTDARNPDDSPVARVPRHALNLSLDAELRDGLNASLSLAHVAGRPADQYSGPLMDYTVVNAGVSYDLSAATALSLRIENLLDKEYQILPGYGTSGRAAYIGLRHRF